MKEWLISVAVLILMTSIISYIIPNGQIGNLIKSIFGFIVIFVMLKPMMALKELPNFNYNKGVNIQAQYIDYTSQKIIQNYEIQCEKIVTKTLGDCEVFIDYKIGDEYKIEILSVKILFYNSGIISQPEHIDIIEGITTEISNYLMINKEQIIIDGK